MCILATYLLETVVEIRYLNVFLEEILRMKSNFFFKNSFEYTKTIFLIIKNMQKICQKREKERKKKKKKKKEKKLSLLFSLLGGVYLYFSTSFCCFCFGCL